VIYANTVSGAFQASAYTNLFQVWLSDTVLPRTNWVENSFARASWMSTGVYPSTEGVYFLPFTAQRIENAKTARESINELGSLQDNWDGYGASPISDQARRHASLFIDMIEAAPSGVPIPEVSPTPSGTIAFEWETHDGQAYLEIGNTRYSGYIKLDRQAPTFIHGQVDYLLFNQPIIASIQRAISAPATPSPPVTEIHAQAPRYELVVA
jgi:hypothetical protein